jgi:hypothetical protein
MLKNDKSGKKKCKLSFWLTHVGGYMDILQKYGTS